MMQSHEGQMDESFGSSKRKPFRIFKEEAVSETGGWEVGEGWGSIV